MFKLVKISKKRIIIDIAVIIALSVFCFCQNNILTVDNIDYENQKIPNGFDNYKIVQISDLHNKSFGINQKLLIDKVSNLSPDIIVITGDLIDGTHTNVNKAMDFISCAVNIAPIYYVSGNHEEQQADKKDYEELLTRLGQYRVNIINDDSVTLECGGDKISLIGVSAKYNGIDSLKKSCEGAEDFKILLSHYPEILSEYEKQGVDLAFTGHAHGGQFRIPFTNKGIYSPDQGLFPEYTNGVYTDGNCSMIVSRGLGNSGFPLRLFNLPDIVVVTLHS